MAQISEALLSILGEMVFAEAEAKSKKQNHGGEEAIPRAESKQELCTTIEALVLRSVGEITARKAMEFSHPSRRWSNVVFTDRLELGEAVSRVSTGKPASRPKVLLITQVLERLHALLQQEPAGTVTQRELFYQLLPPSQRAVADAVACVASELRVPPWTLGVLATSKGRVAGPLNFELHQERRDCSGAAGITIPADIFKAVHFQSSAKFVLIVEKDAIFQKLLEEGIQEKLGPVILVTGKGYPDVATRQLVCALWQALRLPTLVLVDADPHGIEIMCVYRFGSLSLAEYPELALPTARWVGVHPTDIAPLGIDAAGGLAPMTDHDIQKARKLLNRPFVTTSPQITRQVEELLRLGMKAEIEGVDKFEDGYLTNTYLFNKIANNDVI